MADMCLFATQVAPYFDGPAGVHGVLNQATTAIAQISEIHGLTAERVDDVRSLPVDLIHEARVLALFTIGETPWSADQRAAISENVRAGRLGILAIHSATDASHGWDDYGQLVGARFDGHPWTQDFTIDVLDRTHPACAHLGEQMQWHDEVYQFKNLRPDAQVLLRVHDGQLDFSAKGARPPEFGYPLAWCFSEGAGRTFSTSLGHFPLAWETPDYVRHLSGGLGWILDA
jgi:type 1 glutamine amidotransferase